MTVLLRRTIHDHLRRAQPEKILNVFQRVHLRFFLALRRSSGRTSFTSSQKQCRTGSQGLHNFDRFTGLLVDLAQDLRSALECLGDGTSDP